MFEAASLSCRPTQVLRTIVIVDSNGDRKPVGNISDMPVLDSEKTR
jgi:hypothetical protein